MNIPDFMPVLSRGAHVDPSEGACVMEMVSFLAGEKWSDLPTCTNPVLARAAQHTNDDLEDDQRHRLVPLISRLMGTIDKSDAVDLALASAAADYVAPLLNHDTPLVREEAYDAIHRASTGSPWSKDSFSRAVSAVSSAHLAVHFAEEDTVAFLSHLLDTYDEVTGRTAPAVVTEDDLRRCAELTGATR